MAKQYNDIYNDKKINYKELNKDFQALQLLEKMKLNPNFIPENLENIEKQIKNKYLSEVTK